jgi:hypothetical protein
LWVMSTVEVCWYWCGEGRENQWKSKSQMESK